MGEYPQQTGVRATGVGWQAGGMGPPAREALCEHNRPRSGEAVPR